VRPAAPLPDGPFHVPISTIDWLVSRESPAARFVALRDLLARPPKDLELRKARQALPRDMYVRDVLALLRAKLSPGASLAEFERKYDGGFWLVLSLVDIGGDTALPALEHATDVLLARWEKAFVEIERHDAPPADPLLFSLVCHALTALGHASDPRVLSGADWLARQALAGRGSSSKTLLVLGAIPEAHRTDPMTRAIAFITARAEGVELPRPVGPPPDKAFLQPGFPTGDTTDFLELLHALAAAGAPMRPGFAHALSLLLARADHRGRWKLERTPGRVPVPLERSGELSRWVTVRALGVLQHFVGLSIEGVKATRRATG
jgi:hypothetical protein